MQSTRRPKSKLLSIASIAIGATLAFCAAPASAANFEYLGEFGGYGPNPGEFGLPWGSAIGTNNQIYVADALGNRVSRFNADQSYIDRFGTAGSAGGEFQGATGVATDSSGNVYVADSGNHRVQKFSSTGDFIYAMGYGVQDGSSAFQVCTSGCQAGSNGPANGQFDEVIGLTVIPSGDIYVVDKKNNRIQHFSGGSTPAYVGSFGGPGGGAGDLNDPTGIDYDSNGNFYVTEFVNDRVSKFNAAGNFVSTFGYGVQDGSNVFQVCTSGCQTGIPGGGVGQMDAPNGLAVGRSANAVYVADGNNNRMLTYGLNGSYESTFGYSGPNAVSGAASVTVDCRGAVYVPNTGDAMVKRYGPDGTKLCSEPDPTPTPTPNPNPAPNPTPNPGPAVAPTVFDLQVTPKRFRIGGKTTAGNRTRCKAKKNRKKCAQKSTELKFRSSSAGNVRFTIDGVVKGRKVGSKCKRVTRSNRKKRPCTIYRRATSFTSTAKAGENSIKFTGKFGKKKLRPGNYRVTAVGTGSDGRLSKASSTTFTILRR